jgi:hypothetical protein
MRLVTSVAVLMTCMFAAIVSTGAAAMAQTPGQIRADGVRADEVRSDQEHATQDTSSSPPADATVPASSVTTFGNWMQQSGEMMQRGVANMGAGFGEMVGAIGGQANRATQDAADAARSAATSVSRLPKTGVTTGNERCAVAPNGAPDCRGAAATLCRMKGYAGGSSVDSVTVENCPPPWRTSPRSAPEGACTMEHYVTKALCQ